MEPGRVPCALKCTLILTSDLVKGWYGHLKKVDHACQIWPNFRHFEIQDGHRPKFDIFKKRCVHGRYVYQNEALSKENIYQDHLD